jgi:hypothetical protein
MGKSARVEDEKIVALAEGCEKAWPQEACEEIFLSD